MRKSLGDKRREIPLERAQDIVKILGTFEDGEDGEDGDTRKITKDGKEEEVSVSRIYPTTHFGFRKITVERPLRLSFAATPERIARLDDEKRFQALAQSKKKGAAAAKQQAEGARCKRKSAISCAGFRTPQSRTERSSSACSTPPSKRLPKSFRRRSARPLFAQRSPNATKVPRLRLSTRSVRGREVRAMVSLDIQNSRMKDFHDICALAGEFACHGPSLQKAVAACFERRATLRRA